ncbi:hypothetical protein PENTCL1PPCAC_17718 [Pristionchus entomophagus]|uniref:Uncharacterized protein n=1 Tax=Pristionchus entomophagus TaxID=358040 RepID=A0AAV5TMT5_9BILA|nr:hypothetical protein PENTCL1PPCAC_17718 [Pristionchus entomophagus]
MHLLIALLFSSLFLNVSSSTDAEDRLMIDLFRGYNALVQPIRNKSDIPLVVKIGMQLILLINVDEKDQVMHTNVWLTLEWHDFQLRWSPIEYEGVTEIRVAPEKIWLPDIVLFNNADGNYEVSFMCNALIKHDGTVLWVPPAIYKSSCIIDVEYFPFDEQTCHLIFGSWTYGRDEIQLDFAKSDMVDLQEYSPSSIWDLIDAPAELVADRSRIEFLIKIRRKTLFYTVVLILPTVLMAFLNVTVFYLPTASGEKMGLTMNVLLSIVVFLLLVSKILPPTSSSIPLVAKYLLLTFVLNIITIVITVVVCNIFFRSPITHRLPPWVRRLFLEILPMIMCMQRPPRDRGHFDTKPKRNGALKNATKGENHHPHCLAVNHMKEEKILSSTFNEDLSPNAQRAVDAIEFITDSIRDDAMIKEYRDDWKFVSMVVDRLLLYFFLGITLGGTIGIICSAPTVFDFIDQKEELKKLTERYRVGLFRDNASFPNIIHTSL